MDLGAALPGARRIGVGHARGVDMSSVRLVHDEDYPFEIEQRVHLRRLGQSDLVEADVELTRLGLLDAQLVRPVRRAGEIKGAGTVYAAGLTRLAFQLIVELHGVVLQAGDVVVVVQAVDAGRRVPGRARGELASLQQDDVGPTELGEMI